VRQQIDNLYTAYVDVLAARETVRYARASIRGLDRILQVTRSLLRGGERTIADVNRIEIQRNAADVGLAEAEAALREAKRALIPLLNLRLDQAEGLELRGTIRDQAPLPPPADELIHLALESRPDLVAFRLGVQYAQSDVRLAQAQRFQDVFLLAQPYTFQNNEPFHAKSAHSWAVGVTVPLPIFDRNQGRIQRAHINVRQTQMELATLEQQVTTEVRQSERRYATTRASALRIQRDLLPMAAHVRDDALRRYRGGEADIVDFLNAQREYNDLVRQYRDTLIRHRRNMLDLNTAVGQRILP
jgi:outer membrane protein, heavy metal efflux system